MFAKIDVTIMENSATTTDPADSQSTSPDRKSYLAAFLLTVFAGFIGVNRLYTGHVVNARVRTALFILGGIAPVLFVLSVPAGIIGTAIAFIASSAVTLWWYVDLWLYYLGDVKDRKTGTPLVKLSASDASWAKNIMISIHLAIVLLPLLFGIAVALGVQQLQNYLPTQNSSSSSSQQEQLLKQLQSTGL
jgi:hypothetical protein